MIPCRSRTNRSLVERRRWYPAGKIFERLELFAMAQRNSLWKAKAGLGDVMVMRWESDVQIQDIRNHPPELLRGLESLLLGGASLTPDPAFSRFKTTPWCTTFTSCRAAAKCCYSPRGRKWGRWNRFAARLELFLDRFGGEVAGPARTGLPSERYFGRLKIEAIERLLL
jgi:hypothetical protein